MFISTIGIATNERGFGERSYCFGCFIVWWLFVLLVSQWILVFHIRSELPLINMSDSGKSSFNVMQSFFYIHCFFYMIDLSVSSPLSLCLLKWLSLKLHWVTTCWREVDGVLASMDIDVTTPPSSPPVSFLKSWTISERQGIEDRRKNNKTKEKQLKLKYEKMKSNRQ